MSGHWKEIVRFEMPGKPEQRGSKIAGLSKKGRFFQRDANPRSGDWMKRCKNRARTAWEAEPIQGPIAIQAQFYFERPKSHYRAGRYSDLLKETAPGLHHVNMPDLDKLQRALGDAITGAIIKDDSQIVQWETTKQWAKEAKTKIVVYSWGESEK